MLRFLHLTCLESAYEDTFKHVLVRANIHPHLLSRLFFIVVHNWNTQNEVSRDCGKVLKTALKEWEGRRWHSDDWLTQQLAIPLCPQQLWLTIRRTGFPGVQSRGEDGMLGQNVVNVLVRLFARCGGRGVGMDEWEAVLTSIYGSNAHPRPIHRQHKVSPQSRIKLLRT